MSASPHDPKTCVQCEHEFELRAEASKPHSGPYLAAEGETWVLKSDYDGLVEQLEAAREVLEEFVGYDWHATQHLMKPLEDWRALPSDTVEKLKRTRIKAQYALASYPASEPEPR